MNAIRTSKPVKRTYSRGKGTQTIYYYDRLETGLRISRIDWEDGFTDLTLIKGDGRNPDFKRYGKTVTVGIDLVNRELEIMNLKAKEAS